MDTAATLTGYRCADCQADTSVSVDPRTCSECGGSLELALEYTHVEPTPTASGSDRFIERTGLAPLLGLENRIDLGQGETPLLDAGNIARDLGVGEVAVKDEGQNPTGGLVDRGINFAVGAAREFGATVVALPTMGNGGQAAALAAARAGLNSQSFAPSRTPFVNKAMINVHDGDMAVVEGRYRDAEATYQEAIIGEDWYPLAPFSTPFRQAGVKPLAYELAAARSWSAPDWVIVPTGQATSLVGIYRGFHDLVELGLINSMPRLVAAQADGCAPLVKGIAQGGGQPISVEYPDTVVGPLEIPDPIGGDLAIEAIHKTNGRAVSVPDTAILEGAQTLAEAGLPTSVTGGAALAAARDLSETDRLDTGDTLVFVNPVAGTKEADLLRSHLMRQGA